MTVAANAMQVRDALLRGMNPERVTCLRGEFQDVCPSFLMTFR
jgi:hypothetical protein